MKGEERAVKRSEELHAEAIKHFDPPSAGFAMLIVASELAALRELLEERLPAQNERRYTAEDCRKWTGEPR